MPTPNNDRLHKRLRRIAGQVAGLQKMVDDNRYCVDILTQLAAIRSALDAVGVELLSDHIQHCVSDSHSPAAHPQAKQRSHDQLVQETRLVLSRFLR